MTNQELLTPSKIIYSNRKTISLVVDYNGDFIVKAPINCSISKIDNFIKDKADWIIKKRISESMNNRAKITATAGEIINLVGKDYKIQQKEVKSGRMVENTIILPTKNSLESLVRLLKRFAKVYLDTRVKQISTVMNTEYSSVSVNSAKTNWGSCSFDNKLHFTFRLMFCPENVIDYIIIHELTHTKTKNHSKKFWSGVAKFCPSYKLCNKWLKDNRAIMHMI